MVESQCPHCGHIVTGFEQRDWEARQQLLAEIEKLKKEKAQSDDDWADVGFNTLGLYAVIARRAKRKEEKS